MCPFIDSLRVLLNPCARSPPFSFLLTGKRLTLASVNAGEPLCTTCAGGLLLAAGCLATSGYIGGLRHLSDVFFSCAERRKAYSALAQHLSVGRRRRPQTPTTHTPSHQKPQTPQNNTKTEQQPPHTQTDQRIKQTHQNRNTISENKHRKQQTTHHPTRPKTQQIPANTKISHSPHNSFPNQHQTQ